MPKKIYHRQMPDKPVHVVFEHDGEKFYGVDLQEITSRGRWEEVRIAMEHYTTFRMTRDEVKKFQDSLIEIVNNPVGETPAAMHMHLSNKVTFAIKEWQTRDKMFFGENFVAHLAALIFFKLEDDIETGLEEDELYRRMDLFKKKVGVKALSMEPLQSALKQSTSSPVFSQTLLNKIGREWAIIRAQSQFWMEKEK